MNRKKLATLRAALKNDSQRVAFDQITRLPLAEELTYREDRNGVRHEDAQTLPFFAEQLEHVYAEVEREEFPELPMANGDVIPHDSSVDEGAETFTYYLYTGAGIARFLASYSGGSLPMVTIQAAKVTGNVEPMGNAYGWTTRDVRNAAFARTNLETEQAMVARRAHEELLNRVGFWGREDLGLPGLLNHPNIIVSDVLSGASGDTWPDKTADEIILDVAMVIHTVDEMTHGIEKVNRLYISRPRFNLIRAMRLGPGPGDAPYTVLRWLKETFPEVEFLPLDELAPEHSDGNLSEHAMFAYTANAPRKAVLVVPMPFKQYPLQQVDLNFKVPCESSTGGVKMPRPMMCHRVDGI